MRIGLFLDVDKTLTTNIIQKEYASALGCQSEYSALEAALESRDLDEHRFGEKIATLFASHGLTVEQAAVIAERVNLRPGVQELLSLDVEKHLVSRGPSYYIDQLAERYSIPNANVCRSEYRFNAKSGLLQACSAVGRSEKVFFVKERLHDFHVSIGIGDDVEQDGPFVSECTIPLLTAVSNAFLQVSDFTVVVDLVQKLLVS